MIGAKRGGEKYPCRSKLNYRNAFLSLPQRFHCLVYRGCNVAAGLPSDPVRKLDETIFALNLDRQSLVDNHSCLLSPAAILHLAEKEEKQEADRDTEKRHDERPLEKAVVVRQDYGTNALTYVVVHVLR